MEETSSRLRPYVDWDVSKVHINLINIFTDSISRGQIYRTKAFKIVKYILLKYSRRFFLERG